MIFDIGSQKFTAVLAVLNFCEKNYSRPVKGQSNESVVYPNTGAALLMVFIVEVSNQNVFFQVNNQGCSSYVV